MWRWADDRWSSRGGAFIPYDKVEHFLAHFFGLLGLVWLGADKLESMYFLSVAGLLWEVKDGLLPWETAGALGGDGFSWRDLCANLLGMFSASLFL